MVIPLILIHNFLEEERGDRQTAGVSVYYILIPIEPAKFARDVSVKTT